MNKDERNNSMFITQILSDRCHGVKKVMKSIWKINMNTITSVMLTGIQRYCRDTFYDG